jgi:hypothetical protein
MVEFRGFIDQVEALANELEPSAVLLFQDDPPVGAGSTIGTPLQYLHGFTAFDLQEKYINPAALAEQIADWQTAGHTVYWIMGPQLSGNQFPLSLTPVKEVQFHLPRLEQSYDHFPVRHEELLIPIDVYKLQSDCRLPVKVDIGALDGPYVRSGFHDKEKLAGASVRWTTGEASFEIPCLPTRVPETLSLAVRVSPGRPEGLPLAWLSIEVDGKSIGEWKLKRDFQVVETRVPGALLQGPGHVLTLRSDTWVPQQHGVNSDLRTLGVLVDWIDISDEQS